MKTKLKNIVIAALCSAGVANTYAQESINFVSWGGSTQDAQTEAWALPFTGETGIKVIQDGPTDYGKLKAMVESGT